MQEHAYLGQWQTLPDAFVGAQAGDPARPLLTWYDDDTGERVELSGATMGNWIAKTANLLIDGVGLGNGDTAHVDAPPHWQTAAILLGCWTAGLRVTTAGDHASGADVVFAAAARAGDYAGTGAEVFGLALAPMAAPMRDAPPGVSDFVREVRGHGDEFRAAGVRPDDAATPSRSHAQLCGAAADRAADLGIAPHARVLLDADAHPDPLDWLLAPLLASASLVLCAHLDRARLPDRVATERVTVTVA